MSHQIAFLNRCIFALVAFIRLFSTVDFQMCPQIACFRKGGKLLKQQVTAKLERRAPPRRAVQVEPEQLLQHKKDSDQDLNSLHISENVF